MYTHKQGKGDYFRILTCELLAYILARIQHTRTGVYEKTTLL